MYAATLFRFKLMAIKQTFIKLDLQILYPHKKTTPSNVMLKVVLRVLKLISYQIMTLGQLPHSP